MSEGSRLPKGWVAVSLADLTSHRPICYGVLKPGQRQTHGVPLIRITDISADVVDESDIYLITDRLSKEFARSILRGGEVLLSIQGTIGRTAICPQSLVGANVSRTLAVIDPDERVDRRFLRFWCLSRNGRFPVCGSTRASLNIGAIRDLLVPIAPLHEQHRIVEKIEELFSDLDAGVASLERAKANLKRYRASVLKSAVEGRLTRALRKEHPQAEDGFMLLDRILRERREKWGKDQLLKFKEKGKELPKNWQSKYEEPLAPDTSDLLELPEGWAWATIHQLNSAVRPISYGVLQPGDDLPGGIPLVRVCDVADGRVAVDQLKRISPEISAQFQRTILQGGEVLLTVVGTIGRTAIAPKTLAGANTARAVAVIAVVAPANPEYLEICLREGSMRVRLTQASHEVARKTLNLEDVRLVAVPLPPLAEQEQIVALVEERLSQIDSAEKTIDAELIRSKRLRQTILKSAFEGKLVPQDAQDEPASVLLERIKAIREAEQPKKKAKKTGARVK